MTGGGMQGGGGEGGRDGGKAGGAGGGSAGGRAGGGKSHSGSATFEYPANRKLRPVPVPPASAYCTSKYDTLPSVSINERERCKTVISRESSGLSFPVPTTDEQKTDDTPLSLVSQLTVPDGCAAMICCKVGSSPDTTNSEISV